MQKQGGLHPTCLCARELPAALGAMLLREVPINRPFQAAAWAPMPPRLSSQHCRAACQCHGDLAAAPVLDRRSVLAASLAIAVSWSAPARASQPANIRLDLAPDQAQYDAGDERLREAAQMLQQALNANSVQVRACSSRRAPGMGCRKPGSSPCKEALRLCTWFTSVGDGRRRSACGRCLLTSTKASAPTGRLTSSAGHTATEVAGTGCSPAPFPGSYSKAVGCGS